MYGIFVMVGVLLWSSISKTFFLPSLWTLETAQFAMVAYYILGGPYSIQLGSNVRMDLFYSPWSDRKKAWVDTFTVFFLIFYLGVLLWGGVESTQYAVQYWERSYSSWRPYMWPIKVIMCIGIFMMQKLEVIHYAVSLGHHRSLVYLMQTADLIESSYRLDGEELERYRDSAGEGIFRLSVGLEDASDLITDLEQVL